MAVGTAGAPVSATLRQAVPAVTIAASDENAVLQVPFDATITAVRYVTKAAITGANTNTRKVDLRNRGQAAAGTVDVASLQFDSGVNAVALEEKVITLNATPANLDVTQGDTLTWESLAVGTGLADPGGLVEVDLARR